jgi:hypothetical protein
MMKNRLLSQLSSENYYYLTKRCNTNMDVKI